jgi:hypothetical protein
VRAEHIGQAEAAAPLLLIVARTASGTTTTTTARPRPGNAPEKASERLLRNASAAEHIDGVGVGLDLGRSRISEGHNGETDVAQCPGLPRRHKLQKRVEPKRADEARLRMELNSVADLMAKDARKFLWRRWLIDDATREDHRSTRQRQRVDKRPIKHQDRCCICRPVGLKASHKRFKSRAPLRFNTSRSILRDILEHALTKLLGCLGWQKLRDGLAGWEIKEEDCASYGCGETAKDQAWSRHPKRCARCCEVAGARP